MLKFVFVAMGLAILILRLFLFLKVESKKFKHIVNNSAIIMFPGVKAKKQEDMKFRQLYNF